MKGRQWRRAKGDMEGGIKGKVEVIIGMDDGWLE